jgi:hypothetical protein
MTLYNALYAKITPVSTAKRAWSAPAFIALGVALVVSACGSKTGFSEDGASAIDTDGGLPPSEAGADVDPGPPNCGNGSCGDDENCLTCSVDCGLCAGCGDKSCSGDETCSSCPQDCGICDTCQDGYCRAPETCLTCAPDCGKCASCGDKTCDSKTEDCYSCPEDCGKCEGCGDGACKNGETCASCSQDCGVCAVCGNQKCEPPYETCTNCHQDCGDCDTQGCFQMLTCAFGCINLTKNPPDIRVSCVGQCVARGCADAQFFFDQAFNCIIRNLSNCGGKFECYTDKCKPEVAACLGAHCSE